MDEKNPIISGGSQKNKYKGGNFLKKEAWTVCRFKRGIGKKRGWCF